MSQYPTTGGGQSQTLIELILALKGLAQTFDLAHGNLKTLIENEAKANARELDRIRDMLGKNSQSLSILPITISDRVEKLLGNLEKDIDEKVESMIREVTVSVTQVQEKLVQYIQAKGEPVPESLLEGPKEITGRIEVRRDGTVNVHLKTEWAKKVVMGLKWGAVGSAAYGAIELIRNFVGI